MPRLFFAFRESTKKIFWFTLISLAAFDNPQMAKSEPANGIRSLLERRQHQVVLQEYDLSCGAAALTTILRYQHGASFLTEREIAIELLQRDLYVEHPELVKQRSGFSLLDMKRVVEARGFAGVGLGSLELADLEDLQPAILPINASGYHHFVVYRGRIGDSVILADPAFGNRRMSVRQFISSWLNHTELGRLAFVVRRRDGLFPPNLLAITSGDYGLR